VVAVRHDESSERRDPQPLALRASETVLLVEDQPEVLAVAGDTLRRHGYLDANPRTVTH
jgi:hypothetical protein